MREIKIEFESDRPGKITVRIDGGGIFVDLPDGSTKMFQIRNSKSMKLELEGRPPQR